MKRTVAFMLAVALSVLSVMPVLADTWTKLEDGRFTCEDDQGDPITGWYEYKEEKYFLDKNGITKSGWVKDEGSWYYLDEEDYTLITSDWVDNYYVDTEGKMVKIR